MQFQIFHNRYLGYRDALRAYNLPEEEELVYIGDISIEKGKAAADYFCQLPQPPDAVFAVEDFSALGLLKRLKERSIKIPEEVGVIGFANEDFGEHITPTLSSVDQQTIRMGREAFHLLYNMIEDGVLKTTDKKIVLEPMPVYRESSLRKNVNS